jgi:hypothetical protein
MRRWLIVFAVALTAVHFAAPASADMASEAAQAWSAAKDTTSTAVLESFISRYSETFYADLARARLEELRQAKKPPQADSTAPPSAQAPAENSAPQLKIPDRFDHSSTELVASEAQRAVLYVENVSDPKGDRYVGSVVWHSEPNWASGMDVGVRGDIEIPDRKMKVTLSFRRNADPARTDSHIIELTFEQLEEKPDGGIAMVPGITMKADEQVRGTPLAGLALKAGDGSFQVGLSNVDFDRARNVQLLKQRTWFDIPMIYTNHRRALLSVEKGLVGMQIFNEAFAAWQQ